MKRIKIILLLAMALIGCAPVYHVVRDGDVREIDATFDCPKAAQSYVEEYSAFHDYRIEVKDHLFLLEAHK